jgi:nucleotide-binding universal stress UspA family protein
VLVPLDGSELAAAAMRTADVLAARFGADLHTVSVVPNEADVAAIRTHATGLGADDERVHVTVGGDPAAGIEARRVELDPCLVCMSTHGRGRLSGTLIGSVARSVFTAGSAPLVAVGPFADRPRPFVESHLFPPLSVPRLIACVDGGSADESMLSVAAAWATALDMSLTILTVAEPVGPPLHSDGAWRRRYGPQENADEYMRRLQDAWRDAAREVDGRVLYSPISVASGVTDYLAEQPAGLLCVSTNARTGFQRMRFGADAANIVRASAIPVLVVPPSE